MANIDDTIIIRTHNSLESELKRIQTELKDKINKKFDIQLLIPQTAASQIAAKKLKGLKSIEFEIKMNGINKGKIKFL